jgi:hypothetical protein
MKHFLLSILAFTVGAAISGELTGYHSGEESYQFRTSTRFIGPAAVSEILARMDKTRLKNLPDDARNDHIARQFAGDVGRMRWTDSGELEWADREGPGEKPASP